MKGKKKVLLLLGGIVLIIAAVFTVSRLNRSKYADYPKYEEIWLFKDTAIPYPDGEIVFNDLTITKIYSDCFFAEDIVNFREKIKMNGTLPEEWCEGDVVRCTYKNVYYDKAAKRYEADLLTIEQGDEDYLLRDAKPVLYLYPEEEMKVTVQLAAEGELTCTYPAYENGWEVIASPEGTLKDKNGQTYNYLYWERESDTCYDFSQGFCVRGEETAAFLEEALEKLGLTRREANEFIVYWLPLMQNNSYNIISFQSDAYTESAELWINPKPDTVIRVFMAWKASETYEDIKEQELSAPLREGFTVVEWGGAEMK